MQTKQKGLKGKKHKRKTKTYLLTQVLKFPWNSKIIKMKNHEENAKNRPYIGDVLKG